MKKEFMESKSELNLLVSDTNRFEMYDWSSIAM